MRALSIIAVMLACCAIAHSQQTAGRAGRAPVQSGEAHAVRAFDAAKASPLALHAFLERMPKGADLHMHLAGAVYAETFLREAAEDNLCINPTLLTLVKNIGATRSIPPQPVCAEGDVRASTVFTDQHLYDAMVDSFSMRSFVPSSGISGHDQFFATFRRFGGLGPANLGEWLDEVATRAAAQNEQYLEIMHTPSFTHALKLGSEYGWPTAAATTGDFRQVTTGTTPAELAALRQRLLAGGLMEDVAADREELAAGLRRRNELEHCGQPNATPACGVTIRFLFQVLRQNPPQLVFATTLLGFELAKADPEVVGINFVQPEDAYLSMSEYTRQMRMLDYLHGAYPEVHIALHAGELAPGLVPPEGLRFHIRQAVELGHAERIGHGVDVMYEDNPQALLREMAQRHVMTEVNLTSNDVILGVSTNRHSLPEYRAAGVPVALSTDDEGVSRIDLTHEYARAAIDFTLGYRDLKQMARTSLEHSFLPGESLWAERDRFDRVQAACAGQLLGADHPGARCAEFLHGSARAAQQWELEHRFRAFESALP